MFTFRMYSHTLDSALSVIIILLFSVFVYVNVDFMHTVEWIRKL